MNPEVPADVLGGWQQGDCCLEETWFLVRFAPDAPLTDEAKSVAGGGNEVYEPSYLGFVVLSQTCDVVRSMVERPYLEIAPLRAATAAEFEETRKGWRQQFAFVPGLEERGLVADLDLVNTIEKARLLELSPLRGCRDDKEVRAFAASLARKRARFAFPDSVSEMLRAWISRLRGKHDRNSPEGLVARWIKEIRLAASPDWNSSTFSIKFWLIIVDDAPEGAADKINAQFAEWSTKFALPPEVISVTGEATSLDLLSAREYLQSDSLELDYLTRRGVTL